MTDNLGFWPKNMAAATLAKGTSTCGKAFIPAKAGMTEGLVVPRRRMKIGSRGDKPPPPLRERIEVGGITESGGGSATNSLCGRHFLVDLNAMGGSLQDQDPAVVVQLYGYRIVEALQRRKSP